MSKNKKSKSNMHPCAVALASLTEEERETLSDGWAWAYPIRQPWSLAIDGKLSYERAMAIAEGAIPPMHTAPSL